METKNMQIFKFNNINFARNFASRGMAIILGDDSKFWVVTMANAARLEKLGYQWA